LEIGRNLYLSAKASKNFYNPFLILFIFSFPIFIFTYIISPLGGNIDITDIYYNKIIFLTNIELLIKLLLTLFVIKYFEKIVKQAVLLQKTFLKYFIRENINLRPKLILIIFFLLYLFSFFLLTKTNGGILKWISDPRDNYQNSREGNGVFYALAITFLSIFSYFSVTYSIKNRLKLFIIVVLNCFCWFVLGSKGFVITFLQFFILFTLIFNRKLLPIWVLPLSAVLIILLSIKLFNLESIDFKTINFFFTEVIFSYFDQIKVSINYFENLAIGKVNLFYGEVFTSGFWTYIPRSLYPQKPFTYGTLLVNEALFPGSAELGNTPAFVDVVYDYLDFGFIGVIINSIFNIYYVMNTAILLFFIKNNKIVNSNSNILFLGLYMIAPNFLFFFPFILKIIIYLLIIILIYNINRLKLK
jgi:hypothetical protein